MGAFIQLNHTPAIGIIAGVALLLISSSSYSDHTIGVEFSPARELKPFHFISQALATERPGR